MGTGRSPSKEALAAEVWESLFNFIVGTAAQRNQVLSRHELTPNDSRTLFALEANEGRTMSSLAQLWGCDASNATWLVDRLEKRGLAERRSHPTDRRVKLVGLTPLGVKTKAALRKELYQPPQELLQLEKTDLEGLREALTKLRPRGTEALEPEKR